MAEKKLHRRNLLFVFLLALTASLIQSNEQEKVTPATDGGNVETASSVSGTNADQIQASSTQQTVSQVTQTEYVSQRVVTESATSTIDVTIATDQDASQSTGESTKVENSEPVSSQSSQSNADQKETVTQSPPVDQLESPTVVSETYSSDDKPQSLSLKEEDDQKQQQHQQQQEEKVVGEITGEEVLEVIKSQPEQPNGFHDTEIPLQPSEGKGEPTDVTDTQTDADTKKDADIKSEEEGLTFNEWTQKVLAEAEAEKDKHDFAKGETEGKVVVPTPKQRKKKNYASADCGAKILAFNPESTNPRGILNSNKDDYMINPCKVKKWVIIELCEPIQAHSVDIASLELFSSQPKVFKIYLSDRYPTKDWKFAGERTLKDERIIQSFDFTESHDYFAKFVKVELADHFGDEHFCPLTILRVFGIAVTDYEDINHEEPEPDNIDEDQILEGDMEQNSKNLFDSARDTVMTLVKKVLNVEHENGAEGNKSESSGASQRDGLINGTDSNLNDTEPRPPNASIPAEKVEANSEPEEPPKDQDVDKTLPAVPQPGKTDSVSIVTKLEDDEQIETGTLDDSDMTTARNGSVLQQLTQCEARNTKRNIKVINKCHKLSTLCQFMYLIMRTSSNMSLLEEQEDGAVRDDKKTVSEPVTDDEKHVMATQSEFDQAGSSEIPSSTLTKDTTTEKQSTDLTQSIITDKSSVVDGSVTETYQKSSETTIQATETMVSSAEKDKTVLKPTESSATQSEEKSPSSIVTTPPQTDSEVKTMASSKTVTEPSNKEPEGSKSQASQETSRVNISPSPTSTVLDSKIMETSLIQEATPSLPDSWKPDTKDVLEAGTQLKTEILSGGEKSDKVQSSTLLEITSTSDITESVTQATTTTTSSSQSNVLVTSTTETSSLATDSTDSNLQLTQTSSYMPSSQAPTVDVPKVQDSEAKVTSDVAMEKQENKPIVGKDGPSEEVPKTGGMNTTTTEDKVVEKKTKPEKNLDIKVPMLSGTNRESAIMRLSNRIKVLEQNVSLSSRFLEELSKRYKKQSEDMMKLLNKTLASMTNMTTENDIKHKIHEDEMYAMERRLENLTEQVSHLTNSLQNLNQQVTDRQMIATSIEILIIVVIFIIMSRWGRKESLSPEVKKLIESMPSKPALNLPQRRNSISGPATPSKKYTSDIHVDPGGALNKFPSETSLDLRIIEPSQSLFGNQKTTDGVKKKKKKKHKLLDRGSSLDFPQTSHADENSRHFSTSPNLHQSESTEKMNTVKKKHENTGNWSIGGGAMPKKPLNPGGRKKEDDNPASSPPTGRRDKNLHKGHRRQKSLPKQHYTEGEFQTKAFVEGYTSSASSSQSSEKLHINDNVGLDQGRTFDVSTVGHKYDHNSENFGLHRRHSENSSHPDQKSIHGKYKKGALHEQNGCNEKSVQNPNADLKIKQVYKTYTNGFGQGQSSNIESMKPGAMNNETYGGIQPTHHLGLENLGGAQHSTQQLNSFNDFENDSSVFTGDHWQRTSPTFLFNDNSPVTPVGGMDGCNAYEFGENDFENNTWKSENGGWADCNDKGFTEEKGFRKLWGLLK